jgi:hypothetical protein
VGVHPEDNGSVDPLLFGSTTTPHQAAAMLGPVVHRVRAGAATTERTGTCALHSHACHSLLNHGIVWLLATTGPILG